MLYVCRPMFTVDGSKQWGGLSLADVFFIDTQVLLVAHKCLYKEPEYITRISHTWI